MQFFNSIELTDSIRIRQLYYPQICTDEHVFICHWHDCYELLFCKSGKFLVRLNFIEREISAGDLVFIEPGVIHESICIEAPATYTVVQCTPSYLLGEDEQYASVIFRSFFAKRFIQSDLTKYILRGGGQFYDFFSHISREYEQRQDGWFYIARGMTMRFFGDLIRNGHLQSPSNLPCNPQIIEACAFIEQHYAQKITLKDVAEAIGYSRTYFSKLFNKSLNTSFFDYLNFVRMYRAQQFLCDPQLSTEDVAHAVGFDSIPAFYRTFKRVTGFTPAGFLKTDPSI